jgi:putative hydrolase of the HAD superfamily
MRTVHVAETPEQSAHVHFHTDDLKGFLAKIL